MSQGRILKWNVEIHAGSRLEVPRGSKFVSAGIQDLGASRSIVVWSLSPEVARRDNDTVYCVVEAFATGFTEIPDGFEFIATVNDYDRSGTVWHIFVRWEL